MQPIEILTRMAWRQERTRRQTIASGLSFGHNKRMSMVQDQHFESETPVILVGASPVPVGPTLLGLPSVWPIIAVDGGAAAVLAAGAHPEFVLGDMDSIDGGITIPEDVPVLSLDGQDDTDFQKALNRVTAPLIVGLGFLEARFDHSLAAIHALMCVRHDRPIMLLGTTDLVLRLTGPLRVRLPVGSRFSVWPLGVQSFAHSTGLRWPLDDLTLAPGVLIGTSNEVSDDIVTITPSDGDGYAVILPLDALPALLDAL